MENRRPSRIGAVFYVSCALALAFIAWGLSSRQSLSGTTTLLLDFVTDTFGWVYITVVSFVLIFVLFLGLSRYGSVRLGDERPEFGWISWVAMLFSAGVGLSFLFWGTAEPIIHLSNPPHGLAQPGSAEAAALGMQYSFFFWGFHAWALYALVAIAIAYASFRLNRPVLVSSALYPLLGDRVDGLLGKAVDVLAIFAMIFGVATSLGLGTRDLSSGLRYLFEVPESYGVKLAIIACLMTVCAISAATGLGRGIRILSVVNMGVTGLLLAFVFVSGPTLFLVATFAESVGGYASNVLQMSFRSGLLNDGWSESWTFFFWAWWISWAPFAGSFIARISRGRTIREVLVAVVLVPSVLSFVCFSVMGGTALNLQNAGRDIATSAAGSKTVAMFDLLGSLPLSTETSVLSVVAIALLFITSADSASFMLGSSTSGGTMKPPTLLKFLWTLFGASFTAVLLLDGGDRALQGTALIAAVPFTVVMLCMAVSLYSGLRAENRASRGETMETTGEEGSPERIR